MSFIILFALFVRILSNPIANLFQKKLSCFESSISINLYSSLFMVLFSFPLIFRTDIFSYNLEFYLYVLTAGFLCFLGTICLIKALSFGEMSVLGPINSYKSIIGLVGAFLFLGEVPSIKEIFGFLIIICASFLFLDEKGNFLLNKSVFLRLLALIFTGLEAVILKKIIILSDPIVCIIFWCLISAFFSFIFAAIFKKIKLNDKKSFSKCFIIGLLLFLMQLTTNFVFENLKVGLSLSLFQLSSIVSLFLGFKIFKEKGVFKKSLGTLLMLFGSFLIIN